MYKLVFTVVLSILLYLGYQQYNNLQQQAESEQASKIFELEKQALEKARATKSPQPLSDFIQQHPDSPWLDTAIYYRDKYTVQQLVKSRDTHKLQGFINNNQGSESLVFARQSLLKIEREKENRKIQQRILNNQSVVDLTQQKIPSLTELNKPETPEPIKVVPAKPVKKKPNRNDSAERVKRALQIYQKMDKPNIRREEDRKKQQQEDAKRVKACNALKDQMSQFNRRTRWYQLDDTGKRVFMSKQAVALKKKEIKNTIKENCS